MAGRSYIRSNSAFLPVYHFHMQDKKYEAMKNEVSIYLYILCFSIKKKFFTASGALVVSKEPAKCAQRVYIYIQIEIKEKKKKARTLKRGCPREEPGHYLSEGQSHFQSKTA